MAANFVSSNAQSIIANRGPSKLAYPFTIATWINTTTHSAGGNSNSLMYRTTGGASEMGLYIDNTASKFGYYITNDSATDFSLEPFVTTISDGTWYAMVFVGFNSTKRILYLKAMNGVLQSSTDTVSVVRSTFTPTAWNVGSYGGTALLNGQMSQTAMWRSALTSAEVAQYCNGVTADRISPQTQMFYLSFNKQVGTSIWDESPTRESFWGALNGANPLLAFTPDPKMTAQLDKADPIAIMMTAAAGLILMGQAML